MSGELSRVFDFYGKNVRVFLINGALWWVLVDVCRVLGIDNSRNVARRLDQAGVHEMDVSSGGQRRQVTIINEKNLYDTIFRSNKHEAFLLREWVFGKVLPALRKDGFYSVNKSLPMSVAAPVLTHDQKASLLLKLSPMLPEEFVQARAIDIYARAIGEKPEIDPQTRHLMVWPYLEERGIQSSIQLRSVALSFGKILGRKYKSVYGKNPGKQDAFVEGRMRNVNVYIEKDRPLFDEVWRSKDWISHAQQLEQRKELKLIQGQS